MSTQYLDAVEKRRTYYQLNKTLPSNLTDDKIKQIVDRVVLHTPSSFNSQSARLVVLTGAEHDKFWDVLLTKLADKGQATVDRLQGFKNAYGSILFYEDQPTVKAYQEANARYADYFPVWSEHTSAMHQIHLWTALEAEGAGANLQHYNPLPDKEAIELFGAKEDWTLRAQLVFGGRVVDKPSLDKTFKPLEERVIYKFGESSQ